MAYGTINADQIGTSVANTSLGAGNASIMKNRIINGEFKISQYNGTSVKSSVSGYFIDRWSGLTGAGTITPVLSGQQVSDAPAGFINSVKMTVTTAGTGTYYSLLRQYIEGYNISDLGFGGANAKTVTLSFWVKSSIAGTYAVALQNAAADRTYTSNYTITSANTWQQITVTVAGDTSGTWAVDNTAGMLVTFDLGTSTGTQATPNTWGNYSIYTSSSIKWASTLSATFQVTGVQLEVGSSATGFEYVNYQTSLANCQRYAELITSVTNWETFVLQAENNNTAYGSMKFAVTKRTSPTMSVFTGTYIITSANGTTNAGTLSFPGVSIDMTALRFNCTGTPLVAGNAACVYSTSTAQILASAEL